MRPLKPDGTLWAGLDANAVLQNICRAVHDELHERDTLRGVPKSGSVGRYVNNVFRVDPRLSALKHSGQEYIEEVKRRWRAFCGTPKDPATELKRIGLSPEPPVNGATSLRGLDVTIERAISEGIRAGIEAALSNGRTNHEGGRNATGRTPGRGRKPRTNQPAEQSELGTEADAATK